MAVSGVRARRFIQPAGGANAIFARQRGMVAPAPARPALPAEDDRNSRSGKATGRDYGNFFSRKRNVSAIQGAVNALKGLLVGTFIAAKSLGATLKNVVGQINGFVSNKGGGLLGKLGTVGLVAAVVVGVAAIFGPQIQKAFNFLKTKAEEIFQDVKARLAAVDETLKNFYNAIKGFYDTLVGGTVNNINSIIGSIRPIGNQLFHLPNEIFGLDVSAITGPLKGLGSQLYGLPDLPDPPPMPTYEKLFNGGINFLSGYDSLGDLGSSMMSGLGGMLAGGLDSITGVMGDLLNNFFADMGLTDKANDALTFFGMDRSFGAKRDLGSGQGISSMLPGQSWSGLGSALGLGGNQQQSGTGGSGLSADGGFSGSANNYGMAQDAVTDTKWKPMLNLIASAEAINGSYSSAYHPGGSKIIPGLQEMTIQDAVRASGGVDSSGRHYAIGRYQFTTLTSGQAALAGLKVTDTFSPENQDRMAVALIEKKKGITFDMMRNDPAKAQRRFAEEWAGLPFDERNKSRYGDDGVNAAHKTTKQVRGAFEETLRGGVQTSPPPAPPAQPAPAPQGSTKTTAPKRNDRASTMIMPGSVNVAAAPQRSRPGGSSQSSGGSGGSTPDITFHPSTFYDPATLSTLVAVG